VQLEQQIDMCNTQIADLQQKLLDADQGDHHAPCVSVSTRDCYCFLFFFHQLSCQVRAPGFKNKLDPFPG